MTETKADIRKLAQRLVKADDHRQRALLREIEDMHGREVLAAVIDWLERKLERERNRQIRRQREDAIINAGLKELEENFPLGTTVGEAMAVVSGRTSLTKQ